MAQLIKNINGHIIIEFDAGHFDNWCVYLCRNNTQRYAPADVEYFTILEKIAAIYSHKKIYSDFVSVYHKTTAVINTPVLQLITALANTYDQHAEEMDIWFTVLYAGMVAEENKENMILKKRIKRLGVHQLLVDKQSPVFAANFSKGKNWRELDGIMKQKGF